MRYRLKLATWTVVRERRQPSPRILEDAAEVARLAGDLLKDTDEGGNVRLVGPQGHDWTAHETPQEGRDPS